MSKKNTKMGRPVKKPSDKRDKLVMVYLTASERERLDAIRGNMAAGVCLRERAHLT